VDKYPNLQSWDGFHGEERRSKYEDFKDESQITVGGGR
jgi:hypothetical protein